MHATELVGHSTDMACAPTGLTLAQVVLNNFAAGGDALALTATLFQGLFPPINVQKTSLAACKVSPQNLCEVHATAPVASVTEALVHL